MSETTMPYMQASLVKVMGDEAEKIREKKRTEEFKRASIRASGVHSLHVAVHYDAWRVAHEGYQMDLDVTQIAELVRRRDTDLTSKRARKLHRSNATRDYMLELGYGNGLMDTDSDSEQSMDEGTAELVRRLGSGLTSARERKTQRRGALNEYLQEFLDNNGPEDSDRSMVKEEEEESEKEVLEVAEAAATNPRAGVVPHQHTWI